MTSALEVLDELEPAPKPRRPRKRIESPPPEATLPPEHAGITLADFCADMSSGQCLFIPTGTLWPNSSVDGRIPGIPGPKGKRIRASEWLKRNRPVEQMIWHPGEDQWIHDRLMLVSGWVPKDGATVFNLYKPPKVIEGYANLAKPWIDHLYRIYPEEGRHIERWLAHRIQFPGEKVNHALVLGGMQGIGKDSLLEPIKFGVGEWNGHSISPSQFLGRFNGWCKAVLLIINEARDLGDVDRFALYEASKVYLAAPPHVLRVDEKFMKEVYTANVLGAIFTTNNRTDGLYLPADDRRHFVAWSEARREDFGPDYWTRLYEWYANSNGLPNGGIGHVIAHLRQLDLGGFDPKAPPPKTTAFWAMVQAGEAPEAGELRDVIDQLGNPDALTLQHLIEGAESLRMLSLADELKDRKNRRSLPHKLERVGFVVVRNPDASDGLHKIAGRRQAIYARRELTIADQIRAARKLI